MKKIVCRSGLIFCVIYTAATIISSALQLFQGREFDTNIHILERGVITLIGVFTLQFIRFSRFKVKVLNIILPYCVSLGLVFLFVFISGVYSELHPNAYRDIFLNYSIMFIIVVFVTKVMEYAKTKPR